MRLLPIAAAFTFGVLVTWKAGELSDWWFPEAGLRRDIARIERQIVGSMAEQDDWRLQDDQEGRQFAYEIGQELVIEKRALDNARGALRRLSR